MIRKIIKYGDPVLETPCDSITEFDRPELKQLVEDMFETMYDAKGVGLAAPQIGVLKRLTVIDCSGGEGEPEQLVVGQQEAVVHRRPDGVPHNALPQHGAEPAGTLLVRNRRPHVACAADTDEQPSRIVGDRRLLRIHEEQAALFLNGGEKRVEEQTLVVAVLHSARRIKRCLRIDRVL